jgi:CelD/BcsL family acetyltransferase involved in cellulose biosynthesis
MTTHHRNPSLEAPSVRLLSRNAADISKWSGFVDAMPEATVYHDIAWRDIFESSFRYKSRYLIAERAEGSVCGVLPLFLVPSLFGRPRLVAVPYRDRGGIVSTDAAAFVALVTATKELMKSDGAESATIKTLNTYERAAVENTHLQRIDHWTHSIVDIQALSMVDLDNQLAKSMRNVRKAQRSKLSVHRQSATSDAIAEWYEIYRPSQRALGVPWFSEKFFREIGSRLSAKTEIYVVRKETGEAVAGCILFHDKRTAIYGYSASRPEARELRPNDIMLHEIYQDMIERGITTFDFGADSPHQDGLLRFKRKWLARQQGIPCYFLGQVDVDQTDSSASRYSVARAALRILPEPVSALLTAPLVRYFG